MRSLHSKSPRPHSFTIFAIKGCACEFPARELYAFAAVCDLNCPISVSRKRTVRERFDSSMRSKSTIITFRNPSRAAFFRISFPNAPAPTTSSRQFAIFDWSHQGISRKRLKRSSRRSASAIRIGLSGSDLGLQAQDVAILDLSIAQALGILNLAA